MERNWFADEVIPQMRVIMGAYYGNPVTGLRVLARQGYFDLYIEEWHHAAPDDPVARMALHEYLGLTWAEYRAIFSPGWGSSLAS